MVILCYKLSFAKSFEEYRKYTEYRQHADTGPVREGLKDRISIDSANALFSRYTLDSLHPDKNFIRSVGEFCLDSNLRIVEYKPVSQSRGPIGLLTRQVVVQGSFGHCLELVYYLEKYSRTGRVEAARFWSITDPREKVTRLNCSIYIQNIISLP